MQEFSLFVFNQNGFKMLRDRTPKASPPDIGIVVLQHHDDWNLTQIFRDLLSY